jgi:hypothetical protein
MRDFISGSIIVKHPTVVEPPLAAQALSPTFKRVHGSAHVVASTAPPSDPSTAAHVPSGSHVAALPPAAAVYVHLFSVVHVDASIVAGWHFMLMHMSLEYFNAKMSTPVWVLMEPRAWSFHFAFALESFVLSGAQSVGFVPLPQYSEYAVRLCP